MSDFKQQVEEIVSIYKGVSLCGLALTDIIDRILVLIEQEQKLMIALLKEAKCPNCDGSGVIPHRTSTRQLVTHDMASDAGTPELEGSLYSQEQFELEQCQWCDERNRLLEEKNG
ncbi:MAG: hypothetical protein M0R06_11510 [Sphaerochaeta sp.]|jgi:hypothetical protein|nr:hypothetical protein [Sphaerochaeta sp.]MCK9599660.1 hypothetical protein [Sphaerochaeta sp.]